MPLFTPLHLFVFVCGIILLIIATFYFTTKVTFFSICMQLFLPLGKFFNIFFKSIFFPIISTLSHIIIPEMHSCYSFLMFWGHTNSENLI